MRLLQVELTQLNIYDIARFGCSDYYAAEPLPSSSAFADGQGAGLWRRRFGTRDELTAVTGSDTYRFYQLSAFTRGDGVETLVGLGVKTADLFSGDYPLPERWAIKTPYLYIFHSTDGETWTEYSLGNIERADGDYPLSSYHDFNPDPNVAKEEDWLRERPASVQNALMNSTAQWRAGTNAAGDSCLWTCSGTHLIEWDGYDARVTPLSQRATAIALSNGRFYLSAGSRTDIAAASGVLAFTDTGITSQGAPLAGDEHIVFVEPGTNLITLKESAGQPRHEVQAVAYVGGQWIVLVAQEWTERAYRQGETVQRLAAFTLPQLPSEPISISTRGLEYVELSGPQEYFDLGRNKTTIEEPGRPPDVFAVRRVSGRAYIFQRRDFQDAGGYGPTIADMERETSPLLEMLCNPSLADFDITAAIEHEDGHILGTGDGYILAARIAQNRLSALARVDGAVTWLAAHGGRFYALTAGALWHSGDGAQWEVLEVAADGYEWRDALITSDARLFLLGNDGTSSTVAIYDVSSAPVQELTDNIASRVLRVMVEYSGLVLLFGTSAAGEYLRYDAANVTTVGSAALLAGETVTAAAVMGDDLAVGTESGKILLLSDGSWSHVATTTHPIANFTVFGCCLWIGYSDGEGVFSSWSKSETDVTDYTLTAPCATDVRAFLMDKSRDDGSESGASGGDGETCDCAPDGLIPITDAGPSWWVAADAVWWSEPRTIEEYPDVFDAALAAPLSADGSIQRARAFVGPADATELSQMQPLEAGVVTRLLRPLPELRFAVAHPADELHTNYEFVAYRRTWNE